MSTVKRAIDVGVSGALIALTLPLQVVIAAVVRVTLGRPVLFRQARAGLRAQPFELLKFRTMRPVDTSRGWTDDASRLTGVGRWLRSTSLDELPSLWNVLRGDMSLVGPRPLLMEYLPLYTPDQARRHLVRPGVTGLAQVSGRNGLAWEDRLAMDVEYVERRSLALDLRILLRTVAAVVGRKGVSEDGHATMTPFRGRPEGQAGT